MQEPPPLPHSSGKRILPAFLLCFTICAHRIYAGRYISGVVQMVLIAGTSFWFYLKAKGVFAIVQSGSTDFLDTMQRVTEWQEAHGSPTLPMLSVMAVGVWVAVDAAKLVAGKFTDGRGEKITHWI